MTKTKKKKANTDQQTVTAQEQQPEKDKKYERKVASDVTAALAAYLLVRHVDFKAEWKGEGWFVFRVHKKNRDLLNEQADTLHRLWDVSKA